MKIESPECLAELLADHFRAVERGTAKLQIVLEYFEVLADGHTERVNFQNLSAFANGVSMLLDEIRDSLWDVDVAHIAERIKLFSVDPDKVMKHVEFLKSIGIDETPCIEMIP